MTSSEFFNVNERVLCYHGPLIYEAKVLKTDLTQWQEKANPKTGSTGPHYFVHYKGWKQTCVLLLVYLTCRN
jgi:mortality factor 4-like protein 1